MNKTKATMLLSLILGFNSISTAQKIVGPEIKYRRSSLHMILISSDDFPRKEIVVNAYNHAPFPEKYNNHSIGVTTLDPKQYPITEQERQSAGVKKSFLGEMGNAALSDITSTNISDDGADMPIVISKFVSGNKIGNQLVAKWFDRQDDGSFDMKLVGDRGQYDASEMEANIAKGTVRGTASLSDAGEELIGNTFVVFSKLQFVSNEPIAAVARNIATLKASKLPALFQNAAFNIINAAYEKAKEGYSVWTTSYLYKLKWNDSTAAVFYNNYWMDKTHLDPKRKEAFESSDIFALEYIGAEKSSSLVTFSIQGQRTEDQIVELATIRNIDGVFAKLQKKYETFKPKVPLYSGYPITAKIGMKEGLEGGEKFEVLEQVVNPKTGLTEYKRKGVITVDKKSIWDNRYNSGDIQTDLSTEINKTTFKGGKDYYAGMLIREIK